MNSKDTVFLYKIIPIFIKIVGIVKKPKIRILINVLKSAG
jgi:hypothetical protein